MPAKGPCHSDIRSVHVNSSSPRDILHHSKILRAAHEFPLFLIGPIVLVYTVEIGGAEVMEPFNQSEFTVFYRSIRNHLSMISVTMMCGNVTLSPGYAPSRKASPLSTNQKSVFTMSTNQKPVYLPYVL